MLAKAKTVALLVSVSIATAYAADWPGYLGPRRDGTSTEKGLLRTWPTEGPKVLWTAPLGAGFAGPAVSRGKVYLLDRDDTLGDVLRVYDFATGKELWTFAYDAPGRFEFPGSRSTPTVDGNIVYIAGPLGDLQAIDINTHKPLWRKNIWKDFGGGAAFISFGQRGGSGSPFGPDGFGGGATTFPMWGITQNPLVYRSLVIMASQTPEAGVVAYDKLTGELKWKTASSA